MGTLPTTNDIPKNDNRVLEVFKDVLPELKVVPTHILRSEKGSIAFVDERDRSLRFTLISDSDNPNRIVWSLACFGYAKKSGDRYFNEV